MSHLTDLIEQYGNEEGVVQGYNNKELNAIEAIWLLSMNSTEWAARMICKISGRELEIQVAKAEMNRLKWKLQEMKEGKI